MEEYSPRKSATIHHWDTVGRPTAGAVVSISNPGQFSGTSGSTIDRATVEVDDTDGTQIILETAATLNTMLTPHTWTYAVPANVLPLRPPPPVGTPIQDGNYLQFIYRGYENGNLQLTLSVLFFTSA